MLRRARLRSEPARPAARGGRPESTAQARDDDRRLRDVDRQRLLAARHREVDVGEQPRVEQGAVQRALRVVHAEALAQRIEAVALAREQLARQRQRVGHLPTYTSQRAAGLPAPARCRGTPTSNGALWMIHSAPRSEVEELRRQVAKRGLSRRSSHVMPWIRSRRRRCPARG